MDNNKSTDANNASNKDGQQGNGTEGNGFEVNLDLNLGGGNNNLTEDQKKTAEEAAAKAKSDAEAQAKLDAEKNKETGKKPEDDNDTPTGIEIDGVKYGFDDKGNAVNEKGEIVKTKEEVDAIISESETEDLPPITEELSQLLGYKILDETGKPKVYEESTEGLVSYIKDVTEKQREIDEQEFFEGFPLAKEIAEHIKKGGTEEDFYKSKLASWKNVTLEGADEARKMSIVIDDLKAKGFNDKDAKETADLYRDSNKLDEKSEAALKSRKEAESKAIADQKKAEVEAFKKQEAEAIAQWKSIEEIVNKGSLEIINIPETEKKAFYNYISQADESGYSKAAQDRANLSLEKKLLLDYLVFKKIDINALVDNKIKTKQAISLRDRLKKQEQGIGTNTQKQVNNQASGNGKEIKLEDVI